MFAWPLASLTTKALVVLILFLGGMVAGWEVNDWRNAEKRERALEATIKQMVADQEKVEAVAVAYQGLTSELRRLQRLHVREVIRETQRVEYRCPVPESGRLLIDRAVDDANAAASGKPNRTVQPSGEAGRQ